MVAGRDITKVLPIPPGAAGGLAPAGGGAEGFGAGGGMTGFAAGAGAALGAGAAAAAGGAIAAFGLARICLTCSMSLPESNGLGMCPLAPTAMAFAGSMGVPPPSSKTGTSFSAGSARTRWQSS